CVFLSSTSAFGSEKKNERKDFPSSGISR
ncbi:MAG: hypothetical protein EZS28_055819, partial [Streblomastix strix]